MRQIARGLLLLFVFSIPWEYSLDWGEPVGNVARVLGLLVVLVAALAALRSDRLRTPGPTQGMVLALYLWFCCSCFWSIDLQSSLEKLRGLAQEMMIVWVAWEFIESLTNLRMVMRAFVAGSGVLAILGLVNIGSIDAAVAGQFRLAAIGQDPNDVARFLDLGLSVSAMLLMLETRWRGRLLALGFVPLGLVGVLLTASRSGFLACTVVLVGNGVLLARSHTQIFRRALFALPAVATGMWIAIPREVFQRIGTIPEQVQSGDLNQRANIWIAGWDAFARAPILGSGVGTFVGSAGLAPFDTAHNTPLSILVSGGICALLLATSIVAIALGTIVRMKGSLRPGMAISLLILGITSLVATVEENRATWFLLALIAVAGRLSEEPEIVFDLRAMAPPSLLKSATGVASMQMSVD